MRTLTFLLRKEFLQVFRDRAMMRLLVLMPIVQLLLLGSAATFEIRRSAMFVVDGDLSAASRGAVDRLEASGLFEARAASSSLARAEDALLAREVSSIVHIPMRFEHDLRRGEEPSVQFIVNAEDGPAAGLLSGYASRILREYAHELTGGGAATSRPDDVRVRSWYNPGLRYSDFMVPGILAVLITIIATAIGAMNIVREKELGTLEQLNVTPISKGQFIASKLIPFWIIALVDLALGLILARLVFDLPVRGSVGLLFAAAAVYLVVALAIGLWVSTIVATQQQAMFVSFAINMVYLLMSGLFTPVASMPPGVRWLAELSPLKHFIEVSRGILLKGAGPLDIAFPIALLMAYAAVMLALSIRQYSKTTI